MLQRVRVEQPVANRDRDQVFGFLRDVANYSKLMPNVNSVSILRETDGHRITRWDTEIESAPLIWTEEDRISTADLRIEFHSIEGDFDVFRGSWQVLASNPPSSLQVACELEYSVGIPVIEEILGPVLRDKITENLKVMLFGLAQGIHAMTLPRRAG